ncbi:zinc-binding alcohol dehydrogenase family protein [Nocardioides sp. NPDC051685]|uniref:zinc-binding alcohol dehydrogenase family protein n=1 Tax=Nocardioides sp. NPDC051685 TaxID=3364334 RepID=UPI00378A45D5
MLAAFVEEFDPENPVGALRVGDRPEPVVPPGWTTVEVKAASINHHDIWSLRGVGLGEDNLPMILGCDAAGIAADGREVIVHAVVTDPVDSPTPGRPSVLSERHQGAFAERLVAPLSNLVPKPAGMSFAEAACLPTAWLTAYNMLFRQAAVVPGDTVLVQGASGGLSTALVTLGRAAGLRMWVTGRDEPKRSYALEAGAHAAFEPGARLPARVDAVMESVGAATWDHSLKSLRPQGTVVVAGATSGYVAQTELGRVFANRLRVVGTAMGSLDDLRRLVAFCEVNGIKPHIHSVEPLVNAVEAFRTVASGEVRGKVVLQP